MVNIKTITVCICLIKGISEHNAPSRIGYEYAIVGVILCGYPNTMPVYKMWTSLAQRYSLSGNRKGLPLQ